MIDRDIKLWLLKALLRAEGAPMTDEVLRTGVRAAFPGTALAEAELTGCIRYLEEQGWIAGVRDELTGLTWSLTIKGRLRAQQL